MKRKQQLDMFAASEPARKPWVRHPDEWHEVAIPETPEGELYREQLRRKWEGER